MGAHIAAAHFKIKELESATASLRARGAHLATAERAIENVREILTTFDKHHILVQQELHRRAFRRYAGQARAAAGLARACPAGQISLHAKAMRSRLDSLLLLALGLSRPWAHS